MNTTEISVLQGKEQALREALEGLLPIACFGADYFESRQDIDNYQVALQRIQEAQDVLGIRPGMFDM